MARANMGLQTFGRTGEKTSPKVQPLRPVLARKEESTKPLPAPEPPETLLRRFSVNEVRKFPLFLDRFFQALQTAGVSVGMDRNTLEEAFRTNHFCLLQFEESDKKVGLMLEGFIVEDEASAFTALLVQKKWGML